MYRIGLHEQGRRLQAFFPVFMVHISEHIGEQNRQLWAHNTHTHIEFRKHSKNAVRKNLFGRKTYNII